MREAEAGRNEAKHALARTQAELKGALAMIAEERAELDLKNGQAEEIQCGKTLRVELAEAWTRAAVLETQLVENNVLLTVRRLCADMFLKSLSIVRRSAS